jgi:hypothetical protein
LEAYVEAQYGPRRNALGFGPERGLGWPLDAFPGHSPLEAALNALLNGFSLNVELFGWGTGSLVLLAALVFSRRKERPDWLMVGAIAAVVGVYSLYWYTGGPDFGQRYWYLIIFPCVVLAARAIQFLEQAIPIGRSSDGLGGAQAHLAIGLLCLSAALTFFPWRAIDKYYHYLNMRPDLPELAAQYRLGRSVLLIRGDRFPDYASAAIYNPLDLGADAPIYVWDRSPEVREQVLAAYAGRPMWLVDGPSLTGADYQVIAGPVTASRPVTDPGTHR